MDAPKRLPFFGVGPYYFVGVMLLAAGCWWLGREFPWLCLAPGSPWRLAGRVAGAALALGGAVLWLGALVHARLARNLAENRLVTHGVYAHVRNPIYAAFVFLSSGALCWQGNFLVAAHFLACWLALTAMVRLTEEKWLAARFGDAYADYCRRVNRCIPWFPKSRD